MNRIQNRNDRNGKGIILGAEQKRGLTSSALKLIAILSMLIDHFAIAIYWQLAGREYIVYKTMRDIGRIAFPIYCFLLIEGFFYTKNVRKYILRCFFFAFLSEIPFDMSLYGRFFDMRSQNVFFTLAIGLCTVYGIHGIRQKTKGALALLGQGICILAGAGIAQLLEVDYHYLGVLFIVMFYYCRFMQPWERNVIGVIAFSYEKTAPLAFIPIQLYNGKRGWKLKYLFYAVYPVHLLLYGGIRIFLLGS